MAMSTALQRKAQLATINARLAEIDAIYKRLPAHVGSAEDNAQTLTGLLELIVRCERAIDAIGGYDSSK